MKKMLVICGVFFALGVRAQGKGAKMRPHIDTLKATVRVLAMNYGDSIVVRWAPANSSLWIASLKTGYLVKRRVYAKMEDKRLRLLDSSSMVVVPWVLDRWGAYFHATHDTVAASAAQLLYGKTMRLAPGKGAQRLGSILDKYNEQQNRYAFALMIADYNPSAATGLGLRWVDRPVANGYYYHYEVISLADRKVFEADTGRALVLDSRRYVKSKFPPIAAVAGDRKIKLVWDNLAATGQFSAYAMEKSADGKNFYRLNRVPFYAQNAARDVSKPVEYNDSVAENYRKYYYRVRGINAFGDLSDPSPAVAVNGIDQTPPHYPIISAIKNIPGTKTIRLQWTKAVKEGDFRGYVVGRSNSLKGPFEPISGGFLPYGTNSFTDEHPHLNEPNYYIVAAVDTAGNSGRSMPAYMNVTDNDPPAQPAGLAGVIDSGGRVTLHWRWGKEPDLAGYKVYFANAADHRFDCLTAELLTDTVFTYPINLNTLTRKVFYKVVAYDRSKNSSKPSEMLALTKPDRIAPVGAAFRGFHVSDTAVVVRWVPGGSADAAQQLVYRRTDSALSWDLLATLTARDTLFADRTVVPRHQYTYAVETVDSSHLSSGKSFPLRVYVYAALRKDGVTHFEAEPEQDGKGCRLTWSAPPATVSYYILYREKDGGGMRMAANIAGGSATYTDKTGPGSYRYAIKAFYDDGGQSGVSEIRSVEIGPVRDR